MKRQVTIFAVLIIGGCNTFAQGTFQDLDFEEATVVPVQFGISAAAAFPGWQTFYGTTPVSTVVLNGLSLGGVQISLINNESSSGAVPLDGNYSVFLFSGGVAPNLYSASISQTGTVPAGTQSIELEAAHYQTPFIVSLDGQTIDMVPLDNFVHYTLWGGNIPSSMAGQAETLTIAEPPPTGTPPNAVELDDISFSPTAVTPEPDPIVLMGIGGLLFALYRRFALKRR